MIERLDDYSLVSQILVSQECCPDGRGSYTRALQNANIINHDLKCFKHDVDHDTRVKFRTTLEAKHFSFESSKEKKAYKNFANTLLRIDILKKSSCVITTLHKVDDKMLMNNKFFKLLLIDENYQVSKSKTLLV